MAVSTQPRTHFNFDAIIAQGGGDIASAQPDAADFGDNVRANMTSTRRDSRGDFEVSFISKGLHDSWMPSKAGKGDKQKGEEQFRN